MDWNPATKTLTITATSETISRQTEHQSDAVHIVVNGNPKRLGESAFQGYTNLETLTLPNFIYYFDNNVIQDTKIKSFHLPLATSYFHPSGPFDWAHYLEEFTIDSNNEKFCIVDGIVYSKDMKILYCIPCNKNTTMLTLPFGLESVYQAAANNIKKIQHIICPPTLISAGSLFYYAKVKDPFITVYRWKDQSDDTFKLSPNAFNDTSSNAQDDVLYVHKDYYSTYYQSQKTVIITSKNDFLKERYDDKYFADIDDITTVVVGKGIRYLEQHSFSYLSNITFIFKNQMKTPKICDIYVSRTNIFVSIIFIL